MKYEALTRDEIASVVEGRTRARRVPVAIHSWVHPDAFGDREAAVKELLNAYPSDVQIGVVHLPTMFRGGDAKYPDFSWLPYANPNAGKQTAMDVSAALETWDRLDEVIANFPKADFPQLLEWMPKPDGRYRLMHWWFCLFERHWSLRGMTNAMTDYYEYPEQTHRLFQAMTNFYCSIIERSARETPVDGLWTSDDLGTQTSGFFSPAVFEEFFKPYYKQIIDTCHRLKMHAWLHSCGCVKEFIPHWIDIGLDVLHPIQKHTMDEKEIAKKYGSKLTIFAGMDVQQIIPWGTPEEVRAEVRALMDTFWRPGEGRCMITAGNGINGDCTLASLEAFLDESFVYGTKKAEGK